MTADRKPGRPRMQADTCKREGCCKTPYARGMCASHYEVWRRNFPSKLTKSDSRQDVLRALPATAAKITAKVGLSRDRVTVILRQLRAAGKVHILKYIPPEGYRGGQWKAVYARGNLPDAVQNPSAVKAYAQATRRRQHAEHVAWVKARKPQPHAMLYADIFQITKRKQACQP